MAVASETLRIQKRIDQINEQANRGKTGDHVIHGGSPYSLSQAFAKAQKIIRTTLPVAR
jgi:hypothetical protein